MHIPDDPWCLTQIEALEDVERAFVHVDYQQRDEPEHKVERSLLSSAPQVLAMAKSPASLYLRKHDVCHSFFKDQHCSQRRYAPFSIVAQQASCWCMPDTVATLHAVQLHVTCSTSHAAAAMCEALRGLCF